MSKSFGAELTTDAVLEGVNLSGKRVLVTGVSAGLGVETARALVARGAEVVGAARDLAKAKAATAPVRTDAANGGSLQAHRTRPGVACERAGLRRGARLKRQAVRSRHLIMPGVMATPFGKTADGFETQFGTNHLGHFVLVNRIASLMKPGSRLVNLSSAGHQLADVDLDDPNFERTPYKRLGVLRPFEDRQHPVRGRVRPSSQGARDSRRRASSGRHQDRAQPLSGRRGAAAS